MSEPSVAPDRPQPDVVAAAVAASGWVRRRRALWAADAPLPPLRIAVSAGEARPAARQTDIVRPVEQAEPASGEPAAKAAKSTRTPSPNALATLARRSTTVLVEWWRPAAATVVIAAAAAAAVWGGRAGWHYVTVTLRTGTASFDSVPEGSGISLDGVTIGQTPLTRVLPVGRHVVEFSTRRATKTVTLDVTARGQNVARVDWTAKPMGSLHVETSPSGARVLVDGTLRGVTPLTVDGIVAGPHTVSLENSSGSVQRTVTIVADKTAEVSEGIYAGFLHVASPIELTVSEGTHVYPLDERNQALLPAGSHVLQLRNRDVGYSETRRVDVAPGEVANIEVRPTSTLTVTATIPSRVAIDGMDAGETPLANYAVPVGTREVFVKAVTGAQRHVSVKVTTAPARIDVDFSQP